jgi:hypothetical protein
VHAAERLEQLVVQLPHRGDGGNDYLLAARREGDFDRARIGNGSGAVDEARVFEGTRQARDIDWLETRCIRELALAGELAAQRETIQRSQQHVLGVGQSEGSDGAIDRGTPPGG